MQANSVLEVRHLNKTLPGGKLLLKDISFTIAQGEFVGILGPSGTGKTVALKCLNGLMKPDAGDVLLHADNKTINISSCRKKELQYARRKIGMVFQGLCLIRNLTVLENVLIGKLGHISTLRSLFYGFKDAEAAAAMNLLEQVKIDHLAYRKLGTLSGGEMQRAAIARAMMQQASIILADEPISNLDPRNAHGIMKLLVQVSSQAPVAGVFHQPDMVAKYCTRAIAIKEGVVIYDGPPLLSGDLQDELYGGEQENIGDAPAIFSTSHLPVNH